MLRSLFISIACLLAAIGASGQSRVMVPQVTAMPITPQSYPFAAADHAMLPFDLARAGYVEEEYLISGTANIYDWGNDRALKVVTADAPYTTRLLVRRPRAANSYRSAWRPSFQSDPLKVVNGVF